MEKQAILHQAQMSALRAEHAQVQLASATKTKAKTNGKRKAAEDAATETMNKVARLEE